MRLDHIGIATEDADAIARLYVDLLDARVVHEEHDIDVDVELVANPRSAETTVDRFAVDTDRAREVLGWEATQTVHETVRRMVRDDD